ncbi:unnamed protein product [Caenorhabditis angaria]|uniref:DUF19 domain-containing protein n=1 Tax=Caenorhabditis angaria TaxID=860376 RepID=A0A9P1J815_9PELO|nr:unnamed protein product [Caenorhabditis angaria]
MKFVLFFLIFTISISKSLEIGSLADYSVTNSKFPNPRECYEEIRNAFEEVENDAEFEKLMKSLKLILKKCMTKASLGNRQVRRDQKEISRKILGAIELEQNLTICDGNLHRERYFDFEIENCLQSQASKTEDCNYPWGKGGCVIPLWKKYCGFVFSEEKLDLLLFLEKDQAKCVEKYRSIF